MNTKSPAALTPNCPLASSENLVTQELGRETLIYNLKTDQAFCLNETTTLVWKFCDGTRSVSEISRLLSGKLRTVVSEDIIRLALDYLKQHELLVGSDQLTINFNNLTRREAIRKAGLATMIALPVITYLVAPVAAQAASRPNTNGACTNDCAITGLVCNCSTGSVTCAPGTTISVNIGVGVCVSATAAASTLGVSVAAGLNGNVCLVATACVL